MFKLLVVFGLLVIANGVLAGLAVVQPSAVLVKGGWGGNGWAGNGWGAGNGWAGNGWGAGNAWGGNAWGGWGKLG